MYYLRARYLDVFMHWSRYFMGTTILNCTIRYFETNGMYFRLICLIIGQGDSAHRDPPWIRVYNIYVCHTVLGHSQESIISFSLSCWNTKCQYTFLSLTHPNWEQVHDVRHVAVRCVDPRHRTHNYCIAVARISSNLQSLNKQIKWDQPRPLKLVV
jgi:hypothetical protein